MPKRPPIRRGALGRSLALSLAGARAGGVLALDAGLRRLRGATAADDERIAREAQRFARRLGELKGSYVKIGQMFALLGEHFLPAPLTDALHGLESGTSPLDWDHIQPVLEGALGKRYPDLDIEPTALAAASLAQVHRADVIDSGEQLVVKVQYPDLRELIDDDFDAVVRMLLVARWLPAGREFDAWLETMRRQLHDEVDYPRERAKAEALARVINAQPITAPETVPVRVPQYFSAYCGQDVLAIEWIDGLSITDARVAALPQATRNALGRTMLALFFREVFDWRQMQTDPNFGNYLVAPQGQWLALLDFGSVVTLEPAFVDALRMIIVGGHRGDAVAVCGGLLELGCLQPHSSDYARDTFVSFVMHLLEPLRPPSELPAEYLNAEGQYCWQRSQLLRRAGHKAAGSASSRHFTTPSGAFAIIARKLTGVFTFISVLDAEFNGYDLLAPYLSRARP